MRRTLSSPSCRDEMRFTAATVPRAIVSVFVNAAGELVATFAHAIVPGLGLAVPDLDHRDTSRHRADELTEVAAHALRLVDPRHARARDLSDRKRTRRLRRTGRMRMRRTRAIVGAGEDALVRAVLARGDAQLTADAF